MKNIAIQGLSGSVSIDSLVNQAFQTIGNYTNTQAWYDYARTIDEQYGQDEYYAFLFNYEKAKAQATAPSANAWASLLNQAGIKLAPADNTSSTPPVSIQTPNTNSETIQTTPEIIKTNPTMNVKVPPMETVVTQIKATNDIAPTGFTKVVNADGSVSYTNNATSANAIPMWAKALGIGGLIVLGYKMFAKKSKGLSGLGCACDKDEPKPSLGRTKPTKHKKATLKM